MIPKKIHYIWVWGKELPEFEKKCIESWEKILPDYEICLWNEDNFDFNKNNFAKKAYEYKKWAFVSDYIRIWVLYNVWWIYLDTDVEVIKSLDKFLDSKWFWGFQQKDLLQTWVMWSEKWNPFIGEILKYYEKQEFDPDHLISNPNIISAIAKEKFWFEWGSWKELVKLKDDIYEFYPREYFCPIKYNQVSYNRNKLIKNKNTYAIHYFSWTWIGKSKLRMWFEWFFANICKKLHIYNFMEKIYLKLTK